MRGFPALLGGIRSIAQAMCGIVGVATVHGKRPSVPRVAFERMRDVLAHRGPDGMGVWVKENVMLGHRRLAVIDPTEAGHQPMVTADERFAISYNGELYNDAELRAELEAEGVVFKSACDTETVFRALCQWGVEGLKRLRGMFALAFVDMQRKTLTLARDPLGVKPLYYTVCDGGSGAELVFGSEILAILEHPFVSARPDWAVLSAYVTTIRTVLGERTLFEGVHTVRPGEAIVLDLNGPGLSAAIGSSWKREAVGGVEDVGRVVRESVSAHLRSDVPMCCLLSGGLDSSIAASVAKGHLTGLKTYCSGARGEAPVDGVPQSEDFEFARQVAAMLGTDHVEAPVDEGMFIERWGEMVHRMGSPLSTPNEVAINEVARMLRADGNVVTLSGEGADELFGGYEPPLRQAAAHVASGNDEPGVFQLMSAAWVPLQGKEAVFNAGVWQAIGDDGALIEFYRQEFAQVAAEREDDDPLQAHLRFHRRINLAGLLQRLDTATMLEGVEGRTPFADRVVADLAEGLGIGGKIGGEGQRPQATGDRGGGGEEWVMKVCLREAFAGDLPSEVVGRAKASFPLPFQKWVEGQAGVLGESGFVREVFSAEAIKLVGERPSELWNLAWPMINVGMWGKRWWG